MEAEVMRNHWGEAESIERFIEDHARGGMIVSKLDRRQTGRLRKRDNLLTGKGWRVWARSRITRPQENLVLYQTILSEVKCTLHANVHLEGGNNQGRK